MTATIENFFKNKQYGNLQSFAVTQDMFREALENLHNFLQMLTLFLIPEQAQITNYL